MRSLQDLARSATRSSNHVRQTGHCSNAQVAEISEGCWYSVYYSFDQNQQREGRERKVGLIGI
jgi:hypothetical protein